MFKDHLGRLGGANVDPVPGSRGSGVAVAVGVASRFIIPHGGEDDRLLRRAHRLQESPLEGAENGVASELDHRARLDDELVSMIQVHGPDDLVDQPTFENERVVQVSFPDLATVAEFVGGG